MMKAMSKQFQGYMPRRSGPNSKEPSKQPSRRVSDVPSRRSTYLSAATEEGFDDSISVSSAWVPKAVDFATYSDLYVYETHECERRKSFSSEERKMFQVNAFRDAARIDALLKKCPYEGAAAMRHLLDTGAICTEELIGIESMIATKASKRMKERSVHSSVVLDKQEELWKAQDKNTEHKLAATAIGRSLKNVKKARSRAALAA